MNRLYFSPKHPVKTVFLLVWNARVSAVHIVKDEQTQPKQAFGRLEYLYFQLIRLNIERNHQRTRKAGQNRIEIFVLESLV
jgi:hypothetical protein